MVTWAVACRDQKTLGRKLSRYDASRSGTVYKTYLQRSAEQSQINRLKVCRSSIVAPFSSCTPSQWFVLWSPNFAGLWISVALELRWCSSFHIRMQLLSFAPCFNGFVEILFKFGRR